MSTFTHPNPLIQQETFALHHLVGKLENRYGPLADQRFNKIINEVPEKLVVATNERQLSIIMDKVLGTFINDSFCDNIHISAKWFHNLVLIHMHNDHIIKQSELMLYLHPVNLLAAELGGCISISEMNGTTISITFINKFTTPVFI
ncbi:MAG: hypothetical protein EKK37_15305 [Sphingobacteriales bacterium]|nr:MAG: hypothetical protein EKK37_15305 [Sphingobacteriales bacterium]